MTTTLINCLPHPPRFQNFCIRHRIRTILVSKMTQFIEPAYSALGKERLKIMGFKAFSENSLWRRRRVPQLGSNNWKRSVAEGWKYECILPSPTAPANFLIMLTAVWYFVIWCDRCAETIRWISECFSRRLWRRFLLTVLVLTAVYECTHSGQNHF